MVSCPELTLSITISFDNESVYVLGRILTTPLSMTLASFFLINALVDTDSSNGVWADKEIPPRMMDAKKMVMDFNAVVIDFE